MLQDHPIDLMCEQLARAAFRFGQGMMGLATALALVGVLWVASLRPADAAGPIPTPEVTATAQAEGHLGVAALRLDGMARARTGVQPVSTSVCRLVFDLQSAAPVEPACAPIVPGPQVLTQ